MKQWTLPPELDQPLPRRVEASGSFKFYLIMINVVFLGAALLVTLIAYAQMHKMEILKDRGITADAVITNMQIDGKAGYSHTRYMINYHFQIPTTSNTPAIYHITDQIGYTDYQKVHTGETVPIIYDPHNPDLSELNIDDKIRKSDPLGFMIIMLEIIVPIFGGVDLIFIIVMLRWYYKERKFLMYGLAVEATIISEQEIRSGKYTATTVTYEFTDTEGKKIQGARNDLPSKREREQNRFGDFYSKVMDNPTALYDPNKSSVNMLYPTNWAICSRR